MTISRDSVHCAMFTMFSLFQKKRKKRTSDIILALIHAKFSTPSTMFSFSLVVFCLMAIELYVRLFLPSSPSMMVLSHFWMIHHMARSLFVQSWT